MIKDKTNSQLFKNLSQDLLTRGFGFRFRARGMSMHPAIRDGEIVQVEPLAIDQIRKRDIILFCEGSTFRAHRVVRTSNSGQVFHTRGDAGTNIDPSVHANQILGKVVAKEDIQEIDGKARMVSLHGPASRARFVAWQVRALISHVVRGIASREP